MKVFLYFLSVMFFFSCSVRKDLIYLNTLKSGELKQNVPRETKFEVGDLIDIKVYTTLDEMSRIFVLPTTSNTNQTYTSGTFVANGYRINSNGEINFPFVGPVKLVGLTSIEAENELQRKLREIQSDVQVNVRLIDFKVTVLGDVARPGVYTIPTGKISIPEVLGLSGDLNITGIRTKIRLVRHENDGIVQYEIDLTQSDWIEKPELYWLKQNDVLYVEQNNVKLVSSKFSPLYSSLIAVVSLVITTVNVILK